MHKRKRVGDKSEAQPSAFETVNVADDAAADYASVAIDYIDKFVDSDEEGTDDAKNFVGQAPDSTTLAKSDHEKHNLEKAASSIAPDSKAQLSLTNANHSYAGEITTKVIELVMTNYPKVVDRKIDHAQKAANEKIVRECLLAGVDSEDLKVFAVFGRLLSDLKCITQDPALNRTLFFYRVIALGIEFRTLQGVVIDQAKIVNGLNDWKTQVAQEDAKLITMIASTRTVQGEIRKALHRDSKATIEQVGLSINEQLGNDDIALAIRNILPIDHTTFRLRIPSDQKNEVYIHAPIAFIDDSQCHQPSFLGDALAQIKKKRTNCFPYSIYIPINLYGGHWALLTIEITPAVAEQQEKIIVIYWDSLNNQLAEIEHSIRLGIGLKKPAEEIGEYWEAHPNAVITILQKQAEHQQNLWICGYRVILEILVNVRHRFSTCIFHPEFSKFDLQKIDDTKLRNAVFNVIFAAVAKELQGRRQSAAGIVANPRGPAIFHSNSTVAAPASTPLSQILAKTSVKPALDK